MKALLLAVSLLLLACQSAEPEMPEESPAPEDWRPRPDAELPMGPPHVAPPTPAKLGPPSGFGQYYEELRKNLPEGVRIDPENQPKLPAYQERMLFEDGKEETRYFNADGSPFEPVGIAASDQDGNVQARAPFCNTSQTQPCPCYANGWHPRTDWYGSTVVAPGVCWQTDSRNYTYSFVQKLRDQSGGFTEFADNNFVRSAYFSSAFDTEIARLQWGFDADAPAMGFDFTYRSPLAGWGPYPAGWYALPGLPLTIPYPTDRLSYPALTDMVFRVGVIPKDNSWYGAGPGEAHALGYTKTWFLAPAEPGNPVVDGPLTRYNAPTVFYWTPRWSNKELAYVIAAGSVTTIDQAQLMSGNITLSQKKAFVRSVVCHEIGHTMGLDHLSVWQGANCMAQYLDRADLGTWDFFTIRNIANATQDSVFCDPSKGDAPPSGNPECKNGYRPPIGNTEY